MNNVIKFNKDATPDDLITIKNFAKKYELSVSFLYKLFYKGKIKRYKRGFWKLSEKEVLKVLEKAI